MNKFEKSEQQKSSIVTNSIKIFLMEKKSLDWHISNIYFWAVRI